MWQNKIEWLRFNNQFILKLIKYWNRKGKELFLLARKLKGAPSPLLVAPSHITLPLLVAPP
jgi:hypothetical protein